MSDKLLVIMRGVPGCGKTHYAKEALPPDAVICSADQFFLEGGDGEYVFDPKKIAEAHAECRMRVIEALKSGAEMVVVDNTNVHNWEWEFYAEIGNAYGYLIRVVEFRCYTLDDVRLCIHRQKHGVDPATIARMAVEFEMFKSAIPMIVEDPNVYFRDGVLYSYAEDVEKSTQPAS